MIATARRMSIAATALAAVSLAAASIASAQAKIDLTGKWLFTVQTDAGSGSPTMTFKQDGEKLTGHYSGQFGESDFTGSVTGNDFTFTISVDAQGQKLDIVYKGTAESKDALKGSVSIAGLGEGTFTAKRQ
jgi:hypothetical protein